MKVLSGPTEWKTQRKCGECKAELEIGLADVLIACLDGDYIERGTDYVVASCCVCGTTVRIFSVYHAPPIVLAAAKKDK